MVRWLVSILLSLSVVLGVSQSMAATGLTCPSPAGNLQSATAPNDGVQQGRFTRAGNPVSACTATPRSAPVVQSGNYNYDKYLFTNRSNATQCIMVSLQATGSGNPGELQSAAYSGQAGVGTGGFQPGAITTNYLGDSGPGTATSTIAYQFNVASLADFEVVVTESNDGQGGGYNLTVSGCGQIVISSYAPLFGYKTGGSLVGMYGSGFSPTGLAPTVTFGGNAATVVNFQDTALALNTPANAGPYPAAVPVTVTANPSGATATATSPFTYYDDISTTTTLSAAPNPSVFGQGVTLTATVALTSPNPSLPAPGNVEFFDGASSLGSGVVNASNVATINVANLGVGTHNLTATYKQSPVPAAGSGDLVYLSSTSTPAVVQTVIQAASTTTVSSSSNPSAIGSNVTFTASVIATAPGAGIPGGTVTFSADGTPFATGVTLDAAGRATASTNALALGAHAITVSYSGDTNFTASAGTLAPAQSVTATATGISIVANPVSPSTFGQAVTFTVTLTATTGGTPTGTVTFRDGPDATSPQIGTTQTVSNAGVAAITISTLAQGSHTIRADYSGDANHNAVAGTLSPYVVNAAGTTTTLTSSVNPSTPAQSVTFTATVTSAVAGTVGGTVTFKDGANTLGTPSAVGAGGVATLTTTALTVGSHNITAVYGGAGNYGPSTSAILVQVVAVPVVDAGKDAAEAGKDSSVPDSSKPDTGTTDSGPAIDSGTPKTDAGSDAGDGVIAGGGGDDGCGCTTAGTPSSGALSLLMWAGVGILVARRRKRSSR